MPLRKVAPTTQWPTQRRGAAPVGMNLVRVDETYDLVTVRSGKLRDLHYVQVDGEFERSVLLEAGRENLLTDPDAPATQLVSGLTNTAHTLSVEGSGSCEATGATTGSLGTASDGTDLTFTPDGSEDVTFTVTDPLDRFQCEAGENASSFIDGTRDDDALSFPYAEPPQEMTVYARFVEGGTILLGPHGLFAVGTQTNADPRFLVYANAGKYRLVHDNGPDSREVNPGDGPQVGDPTEIRAVLFSDGSIQVHQSVNGGAEQSSGRSSGITLAGAWEAEVVLVNAFNAGSIGFNAFTDLVAYSGEVGMADCRTGTGTRLLTAIEDGIPTDGYTFTRSSEATELIEREAYWTIQDEDADAHFTDSGSGYLIVNENAGASARKKIKRVGAAALRIL